MGSFWNNIGLGILQKKKKKKKKEKRKRGHTPCFSNTTTAGDQACK